MNPFLKDTNDTRYHKLSVELEAICRVKRCYTYLSLEWSPRFLFIINSVENIETFEIEKLNKSFNCNVAYM